MQIKSAEACAVKMCVVFYSQQSGWGMLMGGAVGSMAPLYVCVHSLAPLFFVGAFRVRREEVLVDLVCRIEMASRCWVPALVHVFSIVPVHV